MTHLSRRSLLSAGAGGIAVLATGSPAAARGPRLFRGGRFSEGVMSGDPTPTSITLATRLVGVEGPGTVRLELALDSGFRHVVASSLLRTSPALGHAIKARVTGLRPHRQYFYRFSGRTADSRAGRFRTAPPAGSRQPVSFGVFAGQEFTSGFFTAQALLAKEDVDFVLNLGDYICADLAFAVPVGVRALSTTDPATTLADYRRRYRDYRTDAGLRAMHAAHPIVSTWDDREFSGTHAAGAYALPLRRAAYRAWFEAMPHYPRTPGKPRVYHSRRFGRALDLFVLDTRQYQNAPSETSKTALLGAAQDRFLRANLKDSRAIWKLVASPAPVETESAGGWPGYPTEREQLLATIDRRNVTDTVFVSSGQRRFAATTVRDAHGKAIAPEFACGTVTQPADGASPADETPGEHGYAVVSVSPRRLTARYERLETVQTRSRQTAERAVYRLQRGQKRV